MSHSEASLSINSSSGQSCLFYRMWLPDGAPKAGLLIAHGLAEHSGRYADVASFFTDQGYAVFALDHIGHGQSDGVYGHVDKFEDYLAGVAELRDAMAGQLADRPIYLVGHSMGGLISALYLTKHQDQFAGAILSGAAVTAADKPQGLLKFILEFLSSAFPKAKMRALDAKGVSRDPKVVADYLADPLVYNGKLSARLITELFGAMDQVAAGAANITLPMLILHGADDGMVPAAASQYLFDAIGSADKDLKIYPELYHEIFNEPERLEVLTECLHWLERDKA